MPQIPIKAVLAKMVRPILILIFLVWIVVPFLWMLSTSLKVQWEQYTPDVRWVPKTIAWSNYVKIWSTVPLLHYYKNSLIVSLSTVAICLAISMFAAYALSRFRFRGREAFGISALFTQLLPGILFLLPIYVLYVALNKATGVPMVGTYHGLVITYATFGVPFSIWMLRSYFDTIPNDLSEAAMIEGCSTLGAFFRVILPLAAPGLAATGMYIFILGWNEVLFATVLTTESTRTFAIGLREFEQQYTRDYGQLMAASVVVSVPIVILFLASQRLIVSGLTHGSVKG